MHLEKKNNSPTYVLLLTTCELLTFKGLKEFLLVNFQFRLAKPKIVLRRTVHPQSYSRFKPNSKIIISLKYVNNL